MATLSAETDDFKARCRALEKKCTAIEAKHAAAAERHSETSGNFALLEEELAAMKQQHAALGPRLEALGARPAPAGTEDARCWRPYQAGGREPRQSLHARLKARVGKTGGRGWDTAAASLLRLLCVVGGELAGSLPVA